MSAPEVTDRPLRADAERNRLRILAAAREVFADRGLDASLDEIAARAGVGVGTVYRRFADKDALIDALFEERLGAIAGLGQRALQAADPWEGFMSFLREVNALQARDRGLKQALIFRGRDRAQRARDTILPVASELVARAQRSGALRPDLDVVDLPVINVMVSAIGDLTREVSPDLYQRMLQIVIDGLATSRTGPTALPTVPITRDQFVAAIAQRGCP